MKERSIEEKAKAYDIALDKVKMLLGTGSNCSREELEYVFPELRESEDERIRKHLIGVVELYYGNTDEQEKKDCLSWLEKQGEHTNFRNKIQIGDKVTRNENGVLVNLSQLKRVAKPANEEQKDILEDVILDSNEDGLVAETIRCKKEKQGEQKPVEFDDTNAKRMFIKALERVEEQNNKGYKLTDCDKNSWWEDFKEYTTSEQILANSAKTCKDEQKPTEWSEEDILILDDTIYFIKEYQRSNRCKDENKMQNSVTCEKWLKSLKDRVQPQPKSAWSEEDIEMIGNIRTIIEKYASSQSAVDVNGDLCEKEYIEADNWLKSLKDRYTWKPSEEQMDALRYVANFDYGGHKATLVSLYEQLKKLREK